MSFDLTATSLDVLARLGAASWTDLDWASEAEIFGYFDEAAQRLAELGLFVQSEPLTVTAGTAQYTMPEYWLDSMHVSIDGQQCRPTSAAELLAYDAAWPNLVCKTSQLPVRYSMDAGPLGTITLYPIPSDAADTLTSVDHTNLPTITAANSVVPVPSVLSEYFLYFALQRVRGKESPYQMPEISEAAEQQVALYEQILTGYFGRAE